MEYSPLLCHTLVSLFVSWLGAQKHYSGYHCSAKNSWDRTQETYETRNRNWNDVLRTRPSDYRTVVHVIDFYKKAIITFPQTSGESEQYIIYTHNGSTTRLQWWVAWRKRSWVCGNCQLRMETRQEDEWLFRLFLMSIANDRYRWNSIDVRTSDVSRPVRHVVLHSAVHNFSASQPNYIILKKWRTIQARW